MSERVIRACDADVDVVPATSHVAITIDGEARELDLCAEHLSQLQDALSGLTAQSPEASQPQVREPRTPRRSRRGAATGRNAAASRGAESARTPRRRSTGSRTRSRRAAAAEQNGSVGVSQEAIRAWAREQGLDVKERGRLSGGIVSQYEAAHSAPAAESRAESSDD